MLKSENPNRPMMHPPAMRQTCIHGTHIREKCPHCSALMDLESEIVDLTIERAAMVMALERIAIYGDGLADGETPNDGLCRCITLACGALPKGEG